MPGRIALSVLLLIATVVAGCAPRGASTTPTPAGQADQPAVEVAMREFEFTPRLIKVQSGKARFQLTNNGTIDHDFAIPSVEGHGEHDKHLVKPGETVMIELDLKPGTYEAICTIAGHKEAGMLVTVEVGP